MRCESWIRTDIFICMGIWIRVVKLNAEVKRGQVIDKQGNSGQSASSHLHYEIRKEASPSFGWRTNVNPGEYLDQFYGSAANAKMRAPLEVEAWKVAGLKFLQDNYRMSTVWKATDKVDLGTLGTILSRIK